ncbi:hypothetical protein FOTG_15765 [Fusarium oxysporum f. sp. vasinfectum 25433]|uniref:LysM domain-containing protein n=1 Tax=Fusarium oxysporum f. sp. vasinfectum 25433 TaxID=1089449 RepID=X0KQN1_FUSOX|nr:hypothetical protein FOTG_15765 [Fusarium oxysporum f. sp. vasinfectum 25433]
MRAHYLMVKMPWAIWIHIAVYWTYIASASCNTAKWIPQAGQTIELVLKVLEITQQDFKALNPYIDVNNITYCAPYNVPYKERLCLGSWSIGCPRFLQIPRHPAEPTHTPTVRQYGTGVSHTYDYKLPTNTVPYVMRGTDVATHPTSTANKDGEPSIITTSLTVGNSKSQTLALTNGWSKSYGKPSSEWYDMIPIGTLMTFGGSLAEIYSGSRFNGYDKSRFKDWGTTDAARALGDIVAQRNSRRSDFSLKLRHRRSTNNSCHNTTQHRNFDNAAKGYQHRCLDNVNSYYGGAANCHQGITWPNDCAKADMWKQG